jgi:hypothetical protein
MLKNFTMETVFSAADFDDLGETGVINEALKTLFTDPVFETNGQEYDIDRVVSLETKLVPVRNRVKVILFGQAEIAGL